MMNKGLIQNLPENSCVEVACDISSKGVTPRVVPDLPVHLAALMQININVQQLTVEALITGEKDYVYHAAMMEPHTAAELNLSQIWSMVDELIEAHNGWLPALH